MNAPTLLRRLRCHLSGHRTWSITPGWTNTVCARCGRLVRVWHDPVNAC